MILQIDKLILGTTQMFSLKQVKNVWWIYTLPCKDFSETHPTPTSLFWAYIYWDRWNSTDPIIYSPMLYLSCRFHWRRSWTVFGTSTATVEYHVTERAPAGIYRIRHFGHFKDMGGKVSSYDGTSRKFTVSAFVPVLLHLKTLPLSADNLLLSMSSPG